MNKLSRIQAIDLVGIDAVVRVENENCDFTNRCMDNDMVEFRAAIQIKGNDEIDWLTVYYYQSQEDVDSVQDLSDLDWNPAFYMVQ